VVVVVGAMVQKKGEKAVVKADYALRYTDSNDHGVVQSISLPESDSLVPKDEYIVEMYNDCGRNGKEKITEFTATLGGNGRSVTLPTDVITSNEDVRPGQTVFLVVYEVKQTKSDKESISISDSDTIIDRVTVRKDKTSKDNCDSSVYSMPVSEYLTEHGPTRVKFRNVRTSKEAVAKSHANYSTNKGRVQFPSKARKKMDTKPGDLIEIIKVKSEGGKSDSGADSDMQTQIDEVHAMVQEMYDAYLDAQND